jgi:hypothetical protein
MKHITILLTFALILTACHTSIPESYTPDATQPADEVSQPVESVLEDYPNLAPLALLSAYIDEEGDIWVDSSEWTSVDPDLFREYMFGTWKGHVWLNTYDCPETGQWQQKDYFVFDDSEKAAPINYRNAFGYYQYNDIIIFEYSNFQTGSNLLWLDKNKPDILYEEGILSGGGDDRHRYIFESFSESYNNLADMNLEINTLTRTDAPINQPENGFMSRLRLYEIMRDYDIPAELIYHISYDVEDALYDMIHMNGFFDTFPIYLIFESPNKLVFKSVIHLTWFDYTVSEWKTDSVEFTYTLEKINGEWVRMIEWHTDLILTPGSYECTWCNYDRMGL